MVSPGVGSSSSGSSCQDSSRSPVYSPDTTTADDVPVGEKPCLVILDEPAEKFRFRYKTEMQGTHGAILANSCPRKGNRKTFPKVKLCKYRAQAGETVVVRCSLWTVDSVGPHVHRLVAKRLSGEQDDPHDEIVNAANQFTAIFEQMTILFTKKEEQEEELINKMHRQVERMFIIPKEKVFLPAGHPLKKRLQFLDEDHDEEFREQVMTALQKMNRNQASLKFEALVDRNNQGYYESLCEPVYSRPILNMKNPETNLLKIVRISHVCGPVEGGQEVFIFIEKVQSRNIKVRFFEEDDNGDEVWWSYAEFRDTDVHHQYGIAFKTPTYHDLNIEEDKEVWFQLQRPKDGDVSPPHTYTYRCKSVRERRRKIAKRVDNMSGTVLYPLTLPQSPAPGLELFDPSFIDELVQETMAIGQEGELANIDTTLLDKLLAPPLPAMQEAAGPLEDTVSSINTIPSVDSDTLNSFLTNLTNSGRLREWATLQGPDTLVAAEQYLSGEMEHLSVNESVPVLMMDGSCSAPAQPPTVHTADHEGFVTMDRPVRGQHDSARQRLSQRLNTGKFKDNVRRPSKLGTKSVLKIKGQKERLGGHVEAQMESCVLDCAKDAGAARPMRTQAQDGRVPLTESNIVKSTDRTISNLVKLEKARKLTRPQLRHCLERLFTYTVGNHDDNVFHVMAASEDFCPEVVNFTSVLRQHDLCRPVLNYKNKEEETPLVVAIRKGVPEMVGMFLESGADVDVTDTRNNTALHLAVASQDLDKIVYVLLKKPKVTCFNEDGLTALHVGVLLQNYRVVSQLLTKMEDGYRPAELINVPERKQGDTPLHLAARAGFLEGVALLLNLGPNINVDAKNHGDKTPLALVYWNTDERSKEITKLLLAAKADPALVDVLKQDEEEEVEIKQEEIDDVCEDDNDDEDKYAGEWDDEELFDKATVSRLCEVLDQERRWAEVARRLSFRDNEVDYCSVHWSPSLMLFKVAALYHGDHITAELVRNKLLEMTGGHFQACAEYIEEMLRTRRPKTEQ